MGAWGHGIRQDDFVCDVIGAFEDLLKAGTSAADASTAVTSQFRAAIDDADDDPLFWIALAEMQWTYSQVDGPVLRRVKDDLESGRSLQAWEEDPRALARRRTALDKFVAKISVPKPRPKGAPKPITRAPKFRAGDCLSIQLESGHYAAAIVLAADDSLAELGTNLVGVLDYRSAGKPAIEVFLGRAWLMLGPQTPDIAWYFPIGFRATKARLEVVGVVEILESDPKDSNTYRRWTGIGERAQLSSPLRA